MRIYLKKNDRWWSEKGSPNDTAVLAEDEWGTVAIGGGKTRLIALRRAERTLEKALARVKKMREKEEAK